MSTEPSTKAKKEIARIVMPIGMTALGKLLTCFSEEFEGSYAKQKGSYLIIYVDVEAGDHG